MALLSINPLLFLRSGIVGPDNLYISKGLMPVSPLAFRVIGTEDKGEERDKD